MEPIFSISLGVYFTWCSSGHLGPQAGSVVSSVSATVVDCLSGGSCGKSFEPLAKNSLLDYCCFLSLCLSVS